jgi:hypothetical protein
MFGFHVLVPLPWGPRSMGFGAIDGEKIQINQWLGRPRNGLASAVSDTLAGTCFLWSTFVSFCAWRLTTAGMDRD